MSQKGMLQMDIKTRLGRPVLRSVDASLEMFQKRLQHRNAVRPEAQIALKFQYQQMLASGVHPPLEETGFKVYSQTDEDGILLYLFSLAGTTNKRSVELCVESGVECNSTNLIINHGWHSLLFDGSPDNIARGRRFFENHPNTWILPPQMVCAWIDRDNIDAHIRENGFSGGIDLLSLDLDGMDYWIWKAMHCITPRVVVVEINPALGTEPSITLPYRPDWTWNKGDYHYWGASLRAMVNLGREKGLRFVGMCRTEHNAFFVDINLLSETVLPERSVDDYLQGEYARKCQIGAKEDNVFARDWVTV